MSDDGTYGRRLNTGPGRPQFEKVRQGVPSMSAQRSQAGTQGAQAMSEQNQPASGTDGAPVDPGQEPKGPDQVPQPEPGPQGDPAAQPPSSVTGAQVDPEQEPKGPEVPAEDPAEVARRAQGAGARDPGLAPENQGVTQEDASKGHDLNDPEVRAGIATRQAAAGVPQQVAEAAREPRIDPPEAAEQGGAEPKRGG